MQLWRVGRCLLAFLLLTPASASITRSWFISESLFLQILESKHILFTILIIQSRRASLPGPRTPAVSPIKKIGILSAAMCAFIKFTANGYSKSDSLRGSVDAKSTLTAQTVSADTYAAS